MTRRAEGRVITGLQLEPGADLGVGDFVIQNDVTGLVRGGADVAGYTMIGQCQQWAKAGKPGDPPVFTSVVQGEIYGNNDLKNPVKWPRPLNKPVYVVGPNSFAEDSTNKVFAGRAVAMSGSQVIVICDTTGQK